MYINSITKILKGEILTNVSSSEHVTFSCFVCQLCVSQLAAKSEHDTSLHISDK